MAATVGLEVARISATESPPNFSSSASASTSATIASATTPAGGHRADVRALVDAPWPARRWRCRRSRSARGTVEIGFIAARTRSTSPVRHAALDAAGAAGDARRMRPAVVAHDLVVGLRAATRGGAEAVADLDALDRLDAHQRARPGGRRAGGPRARGCRARAAARRRAPRRRRRGCRRPCGLVDLGDHRGATPRRRSSAPGRRRARRRRPASAASAPSGDARPGRSDTTCETSRTPAACSRNARRDRAERDPRRRLAGAGPLEHRPGVVEAVLLHADEVGVPGPRPGERARCAPVRATSASSHRVGAITSPTWATRCCRSRSRPGRPGVAAVADAAEQLDLVLLELHPRAAAVAEPAAGEGLLDVRALDLDVGRQPFEDGDERRAVGLTGGHPTQHERIFP